MSGADYKAWYESKEFRDRIEAPEAVLGAVYGREGTIFRVWAPGADSVTLCLYSCGTQEEAAEREDASGGLLGRYSMACPQGRALWEIYIPGDRHGAYYTYEVTREGRRRECVDPYARACGADGIRGMVVDLERTDPAGWREDLLWKRKDHPVFLYELHIKDYSYHQASGIPVRYRGKYLAFTFPGKEKRGESTGLRYLKELGITHVHLLPTADFASVRERGDRDQFNWGYDPQNYNIPEGSYATDPYRGEVRIREFKQMVRALHRAGLGVVLDVVYNHTFSTDSSFQTLAPFYYYRQKEDGGLSDGSACGNETASERTMFRKFMLESVLYWAREYHVDGFRFDLMGLHDTETMNEISGALKSAFPGKKFLLYGEPWAASEVCAMEKGYVPAVKKNVALLAEDIAVFCDDTRDAVKGSVFFARKPGFVNGGVGFEDKIASSLRAWCDGGHSFAPRSPAQIITYVSANDNYTLWDKLALTLAGEKETGEPDYYSKDKLLMARNKLAAGIVLLSLGIPFIQAGEEFGRTKYGDENSYSSSASINCLDWDRRIQFRELVEYYKGLAALRRQIPLYADQTMESVKAVEIREAGQGRVEAALHLEAYGGRWRQLYLIANASEEAVTLQLPPGRFEKLVDEKSSWYWRTLSPWRRTRGRGEEIRVAPVSLQVWGERR